MVGPFIFLDQMGPAEFLLGQGLDVRPHPHIGLATVTYLFDGEITHRDSLGNLDGDPPGRGQSDDGRARHRPFGAHAARRPRFVAEALRIADLARLAEGSRRRSPPAFVHYGRDELPVDRRRRQTVRLILGELYGERSPVETLSETIYAEAVLAPGAVLPFDAEHEERAIYVVAGEIDIGGVAFAAGRLLVLRPGDRISVLALCQARLMLLGGEPMDGPRHIWWNFVSSSQDGSKRPKPIGKRAASQWCRAIRSSSRCREEACGAGHLLGALHRLGQHTCAGSG